MGAPDFLRYPIAMPRHVPPGKAGLIIVAASAAAIALSRCKPFAAKVGKKMAEWGEELQKHAAAEEKPAEATATAEPAAKAEPEVKEEKPADKATAPKKTTAKPKAATAKKPSATKKPKA